VLVSPKHAPSEFGKYRKGPARLTRAAGADSKLAMWTEAGSVQGSLSSRRPGSRPTFAEVNLDALTHNLACVRRAAGGARVYAVVKADAYGHGLIAVARCLESGGVDGICVALVEEGLALREARVEIPILVLNGVYGHDHADVLRAGLTPVIYELGQAQAFARAASGRQVSVHLKVDTGMARLGVPLGHLPGMLDGIARLPELRIEGLMTHLASADSDPEMTALQLARFADAEAQVRARGHRPSVVHADNSAGTYVRRAGTTHNLVRVGIALYGVPPMAGVASDLVPAMQVRTQVVALRELPAGASVGYGATFVAQRPTRIATVAIGYGDGLLRAASNRGAMLVRGQRVPIAGVVAMDLTCLDVTDVAGVAVGDEVVVLGRQGDAEITARDLAEASGTIPYEVLTNLSSRVPRVHVGKGADQ
jgi:alanine racemase